MESNSKNTQPTTSEDQKKQQNAPVTLPKIKRKSGKDHLPKVIANLAPQVHFSGNITTTCCTVPLSAILVAMCAAIALVLIVVAVVPNLSFALKVSLSIGCCVLIVAGCIGLLIAVRRPINKLKKNMMLAADLQNDQVQHTSSFLRDISDLSFVFDVMNQQLLIARSFLPEAVLLGKLAESQNESEEVSADHYLSSLTTFITTDHAIDMSLINGDGKPQPPTGMANLFNVFEKRVGVLSLNLVGFHALCAADRGVSRAIKINDMSTTLLTMALDAAHGERGVMDSFHGDHFVLTFNASRAVSGPLAAAVRTANTFIAAIHESRQFVGAGGIAAGAAVGRTHVGTFGIDGYRRLSVVGDAYRSANMLQQAAVQFLRMNAGSGVREGCMVEDSSLKELDNYAFHVQVIGCLQSAQHRNPNAHGDPPPTAYFVHWANKNTSPFSKKTTPAMSPSSATNGEWMYELDSAVKDGDNIANQQQPFTECNKAMIALLEGDPDLCGKLLEQHQITENNRRGPKSVVTRTPSDIISFDDSELTADPTGWEPCWALVRSHYYLIKTETTALIEAKQNVVHVLTKRCTLPWIFFQQ